MSDPFRVELTRPAIRDLRRLDPPVRRRVLDAVEGLREDPPRGDIRKLAGAGGMLRLRVGDWRVRFRRDIAARTVYVQRILPRGRAYRG